MLKEEHGRCGCHGSCDQDDKLKLKIVYLANYNLEQWGPIEHKEGNACFDLRAAIIAPCYIKPFTIAIDSNSVCPDIRIVPLGVKFEIPKGYCLKIYPRSGLGSKGITLANSVGVIDESYRGEVKAPMVSLKPQTGHIIYPGDRIVQAHLEKVCQTQFQIVSEGELSDTWRGENGFGSSAIF